MNTDNKSLIISESSKLVRQIGNRIVLSLYARIREIEALTRALSAAVEHLPKSEEMIHQFIPSLMNFQGDLSIAGGGIWPEPFLFSPEHERRSFFWGRNGVGALTYFDDYNQSPTGYHQESWYIVGRCAQAGQCLWSESYMDLVSLQPMVTCTTPLFDHDSEGFSGVVTIDLKLEGLQDLVETWRKNTGGYVFILDRNNKFITFPDIDLIRKVGQDACDRPDNRFILASELAQQYPRFAPIAIALDEMNQLILDEVQQSPHYSSPLVAQLIKANPQIDPKEAALIDAIIADPFGADETSSHLYREFEIEYDFLLKEAATVFVFHVPHAYWKVVVVKPFSEAVMATYSIIQAEKTSSLGQLVAGLAHEVNNSVNFIYGNINYTENYAKTLMELVSHYEQHYPNPLSAIETFKQTRDVEFLQNDFPKILASMKVGADRIRQLVLSLKNFARMNEADIKSLDLHQSIDNTLLLLDSRIRCGDHRPAVQVTKRYDDIPLLQCYPGPVNQVFMNVLINALDALDERFELAEPSSKTPEPTIEIMTRLIYGDRILIQIKDNGIGIPEADLPKLFDPFFTTKPAGKGTGLGLAICYQIVVEKHRGNLRCDSELGNGACFSIELPLQLLTPQSLHFE
jgi:two-component system, NtrC family, sensor kinase